MQAELIDRIYESAFVPDLWPGVLDELAMIAGARGGIFFISAGRTVNWIASEELKEFAEAYIHEGWVKRCTRLACWLMETRHGFLTEGDIWSPEEISSNIVYRDFLRPNGLGQSAATALPLPTGERIAFTIERAFQAGPVETSRIAQLDQVRPHLLRSALLATRLQMKAATEATETLAALGIPALVLAEDCKVLAANTVAETLGDVLQWKAFDRVRFSDRAANATLVEAITAMARQAASPAQSFPVRDVEGKPVSVAHIIPVRRMAKEIFNRSSAILVLTPIALPKAPPVEMLRSLFDLTPAEARVARAITGGETVDHIATANNLSRNTVREYLKGVFLKTGCSRQAELAALLAGLVAPMETNPTDA